MIIITKCIHSPEIFQIEMSKNNFYKLYSLIQCSSNNLQKINNKWYKSDGTYLTQFKNGQIGANYVCLNTDVLNELYKII